MRHGGQKFVSLSDGISIENVTYKYPTREDPALRDISLQIPRGKTTVINGVYVLD